MKNLETQLVKLLKNSKSNWVEVKFGDVAKEVKENSIDPVSEGLKYVVGLENLEPFDLHIRTWNSTDASTTFRRKFRKGQVLFGRRRAYQRKSAVAEFDGICSGDIIVMENTEMIIPELLPFLIHSDKFFDWAISTSAGSLSPRTKFKHLAELKLILPAKSVQKKIAEMLWALDGVLENLNNNLLKLDCYKHVFLEKEILSTKGNEIILKNIGEIIRGVGYKPTDLGEGSNYFPILRSNNIKDNELIFEDLYFIKKDRFKQEQFLKEKDMVICMSNGSKELVGKAAEFKNFGTPISFGSFCAVFRPFKSEYSKIIKFLFQTNSYRKHIKYLLTGSNINNLKPSDIESIKFTISKNALNEENLKKLENFDTLEYKLKKHRTATINLYKVLINKMFS